MAMYPKPAVPKTANRLAKPLANTMKPGMAYPDSKPKAKAPARNMLLAKKKPVANTMKPGMAYMDSTSKPVKRK